MESVFAVLTVSGSDAVPDCSATVPSVPAGVAKVTEPVSTELSLAVTVEVRVTPVPAGTSAFELVSVAVVDTPTAVTVTVPDELAASLVSPA